MERKYLICLLLIAGGLWLSYVHEPPEGTTPVGGPTLDGTLQAARNLLASVFDDDAAPEEAEPGERDRLPFAQGPDARPAQAEKAAPAAGTGSAGTDESGSTEEQLSAAEPAWLPIDVGRHWTYDYVRQSVRTNAGRSKTEQLQGQLTEKIHRIATEFPGGVVELESTLELRRDESAPASIERRRHFLQNRGRHHWEVARATFDSTASRFRHEVFDPPLERTSPPGSGDSTWSIGVWDTEAGRAEFFGEVLGLQDTGVPAGRFERCLVVKYSADLPGDADTPPGRMEVREWYAAGVGRVRVRAVRLHKVTASNGRTVELLERDSYDLRETQVDTQPPASPAH